MRVTVQLPSILAVGHARSATVEAATVREALERLDQEFPGVGDHVFDERRRLRSLVRIALGEDILARDGDLDRPVTEGATILVFQAIAGGSS